MHNTSNSYLWCNRHCHWHSILFAVSSSPTLGMSLARAAFGECLTAGSRERERDSVVRAHDCASPGGNLTTSPGAIRCKMRGVPLWPRGIPHFVPSSTAKHSTARHTWQGSGGGRQVQQLVQRNCDDGAPLPRHPWPKKMTERRKLKEDGERLEAEAWSLGTGIVDLV